MIHPLLLKSLLYFLGALPYRFYEKKMFISTMQLKTRIETFYAGID